MNKLGKFLLIMMASAALLSSCMKDDESWNDSKIFANMLVTVKTADNGSCFLQLDDKTTLFPVNVSKSPFGTKQVRALANCENSSESSSGYDKAVYVNWIDSILTKKPVETAGEENDSKYGTAPCEILNSWTTVVEDGYVTLGFTAWWGSINKIHYVNLLTGTDSKDPYTLELRHDANGDTGAQYGGTQMTGLVAFDLSGLPDTKGETVKLKINYRSSTGTKTVSFNYCTGKKGERDNARTNDAALTFSDSVGFPVE